MNNEFISNICLLERNFLWPLPYWVEKGCWKMWLKQSFIISSYAVRVDRRNQFEFWFEKGENLISSIFSHRDHSGCESAKEMVVIQLKISVAKNILNVEWAGMDVMSVRVALSVFISDRNNRINFIFNFRNF